MKRGITRMAKMIAKTTRVLSFLMSLMFSFGFELEVLKTQILLKM